jgi:Flp pilus assembly protein TadD
MTGGHSVLVHVALLVAVTTSCRPSAGPAGEAALVGREACVGCHAAEDSAWRGSRHDRAMQPADSSTVLGDFGNATFRYTTGVLTSFFRRDGRYWVRTDGPDGALTEYPIAYTFGVYPLQQYLIAFPGGRYQALNVVWDTRPKSEGGQRWYHLYPDEKVDFRDPLHWTGPLQNWNHMCAECHSTGVRKGYEAASDSFHTTWTEIDVSCEACHGAGSRHVEWAAPANASRRERDSTMGLEIRLPKPAPGNWVFDSATPIARRSQPAGSGPEVETCGRCHARSSVLWAPYRHGESLDQSHRVSLLDDPLYEADGQQRDEVYEYGSFLQSRMSRAGVTCTDCHDPHRGGTRLADNGLCAQCHLPAKYDAVTHHRHPSGGEATLCVSCHMPARNYMGVDARRDHSFGIPRPDLSVTLGTPNACAACHRDRPAAWAADQLAGWFGPPDTIRAKYPRAIHAGRQGAPGAGDLLMFIAQDTASAAIRRATAVSLMPANSGAGTLSALQVALGDSSQLVRRAAAEALEGVSPGMRLRMGVPLLSDPSRAARLAAVSALASVPGPQWTPDDRTAFETAVAEYRASQMINGDRAEARTNLGNLARDLGRLEEAETEFRAAIRLWPRFTSAWIQLAELARARGGEGVTDSILRSGLAANAGSADLHHALGLSLVRQRRTAEAVAELGAAAGLRPEFARYAFVYGVAVHDTGDPARGLAILKKALETHPWDRELLQGVMSFAAQVGDRTSAVEAARRLVALTPDDPTLRQQLQQLQR